MSLPPLVRPGPELTPEQLRRFARHFPLPGIGVTGQRRIAAARVLVIGAGGLGSPVLSYLAAAGVGHLTVIDADVVEDSNLQRQVIHDTGSLGVPKVDSAAARLSELSPGVAVTALNARLGADNALELFSSHDVVVDGSDNFATRYLSSDASELTGTPLVWGTLFQFSGQASVFWPGHGPALRDLFPEIPDADSVPSCAEGGVFGALCGWVGSLLASETLKLICGVGDPLVGRFARIDALGGSMTQLRFGPDPARPPVTSLVPDAAVPACAIPVPGASEGSPTGGGGSAMEDVRRVATVTPAELAATPRPVVDVREDWEREVASYPGAHAVPLGRIEAGGWAALDGLDLGEEFVLLCKAGVRSRRAALALLGTADGPSGAPRPLSLEGGMDAWEAAGRP